ncbi:hypothetical protein FSARC_8362 [Fusarium sarcochroum]|uniref:Uncharacterized protein n=1 Tax=Fusarium sarcochroum TaxID=1208366 RepID=A0A8H4TTG6_9HYPO|nr:hypothetical protein FSARC_8362 [Fusarium sarcochroum]
MFTRQLETPYLSSYSRVHSVAGGATRVGIRGSRAEGDLKRALEEVDGLFAGFIYLDETEPDLSSSHIRLPNAHCPDDLALELDALCSTTSINEEPDAQLYNSDGDVYAREIAWTSIRTVRDGMQVLWEHFVDVAQTLNVPVINRICNDYQDAKGLRQTGVFAFRNTLTGPVPNDLAKIFAFCSLSYVVSRLLYARDRLAEGEILAGVSVWLDALEDSDEREAFQMLARRLWPEARNHLHFIDFHLDEESQRLASSLRRGENPIFTPSTHTNPTLLLTDDVRSEPLAGYDQPTPMSLYNQTNLQSFDLPAGSISIEPSLINERAKEISPIYAQNLADRTSEELGFSLGLEEPPGSTLGSQLAPWQWFGPSTSQSLNFDTSTLGLTTPESFAGRSNGHILPSITPTHDPDIQSLMNAEIGGDDRKNLWETSVFKAVLQYIRGNCSFWYALSGCGLVSKDLRSCLAWGQERLTQKRHIQTTYIHPLSSEKHARDLPSRGIISVAETFVEWGLLQSIEEIQYYMERIGNVSDTN